MEHFTVTESLSNSGQSTGISIQELKSLLKIVKVYQQLQEQCLHLTVGQSLPPVQVKAVENKIQEILLLA